MASDIATPTSRTRRGGGVKAALANAGVWSDLRWSLMVVNDKIANTIVPIIYSIARSLRTRRAA